MALSIYNITKLKMSVKNFEMIGKVFNKDINLASIDGLVQDDNYDLRVIILLQPNNKGVLGGSLSEFLRFPRNSIVLAYDGSLNQFINYGYIASDIDGKLLIERIDDIGQTVKNSDGTFSINLNIQNAKIYNKLQHYSRVKINTMAHSASVDPNSHTGAPSAIKSWGNMRVSVATEVYNRLLGSILSAIKGVNNISGQINLDKLVLRISGCALDTFNIDFNDTFLGQISNDIIQYLDNNSLISKSKISDGTLLINGFPLSVAPKGINSKERFVAIYAPLPENRVIKNSAKPLFLKEIKIVNGIARRVFKRKFVYKPQYSKVEQYYAFSFFNKNTIFDDNIIADRTDVVIEENGESFNISRGTNHGDVDQLIDNARELTYKITETNDDSITSYNSAQISSTNSGVTEIPEGSGVADTVTTGNGLSVPKQIIGYKPFEMASHSSQNELLSYAQNYFRYMIFNTVSYLDTAKAFTSDTVFKAEISEAVEKLNHLQVKPSDYKTTMNIFLEGFTLGSKELDIAYYNKMFYKELKKYDTRLNTIMSENGLTGYRYIPLKRTAQDLTNDGTYSLLFLNQEGTSTRTISTQDISIATFESDFIALNRDFENKISSIHLSHSLRKVKFSTLNDIFDTGSAVINIYDNSTSLSKTTHHSISMLMITDLTDNTITITSSAIDLFSYLSRSLILAPKILGSISSSLGLFGFILGVISFGLNLNNLLTSKNQIDRTNGVVQTVFSGIGLALAIGSILSVALTTLTISLLAGPLFLVNLFLVGISFLIQRLVLGPMVDSMRVEQFLDMVDDIYDNYCNPVKYKDDNTILIPNSLPIVSIDTRASSKRVTLGDTYFQEMILDTYSYPSFSTTHSRKLNGWDIFSSKTFTEYKFTSDSKLSFKNFLIANGYINNQIFIEDNVKVLLMPVIPNMVINDYRFTSLVNDNDFDNHSKLLLDEFRDYYRDQPNLKWFYRGSDWTYDLNVTRVFTTSTNLISETKLDYLDTEIKVILSSNINSVVIPDIEPKNYINLEEDKKQYYINMRDKIRHYIESVTDDYIYCFYVKLNKVAYNSLTLNSDYNSSWILDDTAYSKSSSTTTFIKNTDLSVLGIGNIDINLENNLNINDIYLKTTLHYDKYSDINEVSLYGTFINSKDNSDSIKLQAVEVPYYNISNQLSIKSSVTHELVEGCEHTIIDCNSNCTLTQIKFSVDGVSSAVELLVIKVKDINDEVIWEKNTNITEAHYIENEVIPGSGLIDFYYLFQFNSNTLDDSGRELFNIEIPKSVSSVEINTFIKNVSVEYRYIEVNGISISNVNQNNNLSNIKNTQEENIRLIQSYDGLTTSSNINLVDVNTINNISVKFYNGLYSEINLGLINFYANKYLFTNIGDNDVIYVYEMLGLNSDTNKHYIEHVLIDYNSYGLEKPKIISLEYITDDNTTANNIAITVMFSNDDYKITLSFIITDDYNNNVSTFLNNITLKANTQELQNSLIESSFLLADNSDRSDISISDILRTSNNVILYDILYSEFINVTSEVSLTLYHESIVGVNDDNIETFDNSFKISRVDNTIEWINGKFENARNNILNQGSVVSLYPKNTEVGLTDIIRYYSRLRYINCYIMEIYENVYSVDIREMIDGKVIILNLYDYTSTTANGTREIYLGMEYSDYNIIVDSNNLVFTSRLSTTSDEKIVLHNILSDENIPQMVKNRFIFTDNTRKMLSELISILDMHNTLDDNDYSANIIISNDELYLFDYTTLKLQLSSGIIVDDIYLKWESSAENIATISREGMMHVLNSGTFKIICDFNNNRYERELTIPKPNSIIDGSRVVVTINDTAIEGNKALDACLYTYVTTKQTEDRTFLRAIFSENHTITNIILNNRGIESNGSLEHYRISYFDNHNRLEVFDINNDTNRYEYIHKVENVKRVALTNRSAGEKATLLGDIQVYSQSIEPKIGFDRSNNIYNRSELSESIEIIGLIAEQSSTFDIPSGHFTAQKLLDGNVATFANTDIQSQDNKSYVYMSVYCNPNKTIDNIQVTNRNSFSSRIDNSKLRVYDNNNKIIWEKTLHTDDFDTSVIFTQESLDDNNKTLLQVKTVVSHVSIYKYRDLNSSISENDNLNIAQIVVNGSDYIDNITKSASLSSLTTDVDKIINPSNTDTLYINREENSMAYADIYAKTNHKLSKIVIGANINSSINNSSISIYDINNNIIWKKSLSVEYISNNKIEINANDLDNNSRVLYDIFSVKKVRILNNIDSSIELFYINIFGTKNDDNKKIININSSSSFNISNLTDLNYNNYVQTTNIAYPPTVILPPEGEGTSIEGEGEPRPEEGENENNAWIDVAFNNRVNDNIYLKEFSIVNRTDSLIYINNIDNTEVTLYDYYDNIIWQKTILLIDYTDNKTIFRFDEDTLDNHDRLFKNYKIKNMVLLNRIIDLNISEILVDFKIETENILDYVLSSSEYHNHPTLNIVDGDLDTFAHTNIENHKTEPVFFDFYTKGGYEFNYIKIINRVVNEDLSDSKMIKNRIAGSLLKVYDNDENIIWSKTVEMEHSTDNGRTFIYTYDEHDDDMKSLRTVLDDIYKIRIEKSDTNLNITEIYIKGFTDSKDIRDHSVEVNTNYPGYPTSNLIDNNVKTQFKGFDYLTVRCIEDHSIDNIVIININSLDDPEAIEGELHYIIDAKIKVYDANNNVYFNKTITTDMFTDSSLRAIEISSNDIDDNGRKLFNPYVSTSKVKIESEYLIILQQLFLNGNKTMIGENISFNNNDIRVDIVPHPDIIETSELTNGNTENSITIEATTFSDDIEAGVSIDIEEPLPDMFRVILYGDANSLIGSSFICKNINNTVVKNIIINESHKVNDLIVINNYNVSNSVNLEISNIEIKNSLKDIVLSEIEILDENRVYNGNIIVVNEFDNFNQQVFYDNSSNFHSNDTISNYYIPKQNDIDTDASYTPYICSTGEVNSFTSIKARVYDDNGNKYFVNIKAYKMTELEYYDIGKCDYYDDNNRIILNIVKDELYEALPQIYYGSFHIVANTIEDDHNWSETIKVIIMN